jgi:hypothetical protein
LPLSRPVTRDGHPILNKAKPTPQNIKEVKDTETEVESIVRRLDLNKEEVNDLRNQVYKLGKSSKKTMAKIITL